MNVIEHYILDSANPDWIREMLAMESEAAAPVQEPVQ